MTVVLNVKSLREARGLSQAALAELLHVRQATVSEWETGRKRRLDLDLLERLADVFGVAPAALLGWQSSAPQRKATNKPGRSRKP